MTVAELIAELQKHPPHKEVRMLCEIYDTSAISEESAIHDVINEGGYVLLQP